MALPWPHHLSDPVPLPSALSSVLGQRCRDLLLQLYLQRPEVRVPVPEVLLQSEGATSSSICKVRDTVPIEQGVGGPRYGRGESQGVGLHQQQQHLQGERHSPHRARGGRGVAISLASTHLTRAQPCCARLFLWMQPGAEGCPFPFLYLDCGQTGVSTCVMSCGQYGDMVSIRRVLPCHPRVPQRSPTSYPFWPAPLCLCRADQLVSPGALCKGHMGSCLWCDL